MIFTIGRDQWAVLLLTNSVAMFPRARKRPSITIVPSFHLHRYRSFASSARSFVRRPGILFINELANAAGASARSWFLNRPILPAGSCKRNTAPRRNRNARNLQAASHFRGSIRSLPTWECETSLEIVFSLNRSLSSLPAVKSPRQYPPKCHASEQRAAVLFSNYFPTCF